MNLSTNKGKKAAKINLNRPGANQSLRYVWLFLITVCASGAIFWVNSLGQKATQTIPVVMLAQDVYKNQQITEGMLIEYDMLIAEYEKYSIVNDNGTEKRRVVLWEERNKLINTFAAYPMQANTVAMYRSFIKSRIDNSDSVLYSFPGKDIIPLDVDSKTLKAFKTFLEPGDRLNIDALYVDSFVEQTVDDYGNKTKESYEVYKSETMFSNIIVADLLNKDGQSVLDLYAYYNDLPVYKQAQLDSDTNFQEQIEPSTLLVALTPEEKERYNYFKSKSQVTFQVSLPQRTN